MHFRKWFFVASLATFTLGGVLQAVTAPPATDNLSGNSSASPHGVADSYVFTDLGTLDGNNSAAEAISETGHVVGVADVLGGVGATHAFEYWSGNFRDLGVLKGAVGSGALAINANGTIVGYGNVASTGAYHAIRFAATGPIDLNAQASANLSAALGINEAGQVVGFIQGKNPNPASPDPTAVRAFVLNSGAITMLPTLTGNTAEAFDINNSSQIVGFSTLTGDVVEHAFLYAAGHAKDLGVLPGGTISEAYAINDSGQVVGASSVTGGVHGFLYSGNVLSDLGTLGGNSSYAYGINNSGDMVGLSYTGDTVVNNATHAVSPVVHAFIYSNGVMTDLNDLVMTGAGGHVLRGAYGINNAGQIVGDTLVGNESSSIVHAFLLTPASATTPLSLDTPLANSLQLKGDTATFSVVLSGSDPKFYKWFKNGTAIAGQTNATLTLTNMQPGNSGNYSVKASNLVSEVSSNMTLTVVIPPTFSKSPVNATVLVGKPAKFSVTATGTAPIAYRWEVSIDGGSTWANVTDGDGITGSAKATLAIASAASNLAGDQFRCTVTNAGSSSTTSAVTLTVGAPPKVTVPLVNLTKVVGGTATFSATVTGSPTPAFQWYNGKNPLPGETSSTLTLTNVQAASAGTYSLNVTNAFGKLTAKATLKIIVPAAISLQPANNVTVKAGKPAKFTVKATGTAKLTYQWEVSTDSGAHWTPIAKATAATYTVAKTTSEMSGRQFHCVVNNPAAAPATTDPATLTVAP